MNNRTTPQRNFFIYSVWRDDVKVMFLGKSYAISTDPIISKHLSGKNRYTREYFSKAVIADGETPKIAVIEQLHNVTYKTAYSHLVAWVRHALESGFYVTVQDGVIEDALSLHPGTEALYDSIKNEPLDDILQRGTYNLDSISCKSTKNALSPAKKSAQFNLRVDQQDKNNFNTFCREESLTKKQGFSILMNGLISTQAMTDQVVSILKKRVEDLSKELDAVKNRNERLSNFIRHDKRYSNLLSTANGMIRAHINSLAIIDHSNLCEKLEVSRQKYADFDLNSFSYPDSESGIAECILLGLVYMKHSSGIFVLARTLDGKRIKFRSFDSRNYLGIQIPRSPWSFFGSKWIVAWKKEDSGAVDLIASIPVPISLDPMIPEDFGIIPESKSVDMLIRKADAERG